MNNSKLWALTTYFNPMGFSARYINYQVFRSRLPIPLATAELTFNDHYELHQNDADLLIQVGTGDVMWQKERLINKLVKSLPDTCEYVVVIDADVIFSDSSWVDRVTESLKHNNLVQPFTHSYRLLPYRLPENTGISRRKPRIAITHPDTRGKLDVTHETGIAWAMHKDLLEKHGWYDAAIIGGGDMLMLYAAMGLMKEAASRVSMNAECSAHYFEWANSFYQATENKLRCIDGDVFNLWHGNINDRKYLPRHKLLTDFNFNPSKDLSLTADDTWQWNSDKPEFHKSVSDYFRSRQEDGKFINLRHEHGDSKLFLEV